MQLVQGVGVNDRSISSQLNGKDTKEYTLWRSMLYRCYSKPYLEKHPTYVGCSVSDTFLYYHLFNAWCQTQVGFGKEGYHLDKDLLIKGNKVYSEDTCVFIPKEVNNLLVKSNSIRGLYPIGVSKKGLKFQARCTIFGKPKHLGYFDTPELAFEAYKLAKENHIKDIVHKYKDSIDIRVFNALINYKVDIGD